MTAVLLASDSGGAAGLRNMSILRMARMAKMTRMARMAKVLRAVPELVVLMKGVSVASRSMFVTLFLLMIIIYVFAVAFRQLTEGTNIGEDYFKSVPSSMNSLLLRGALPDHFEMVNSVADELWYLWPFIMLFILLASLTVMNMLVGILVEVVAAITVAEKEEMTVGYIKRELLSVMSKLDDDKDETLSQREFEGMLLDPMILKIMQGAGVDVIGLVDLSDVIFHGKEEGLHFEEFLETVLNLRSSNTATVKDIMTLLKFLKSEMDKNSKKLIENMHRGGQH